MEQKIYEFTAVIRRVENMDVGFVEFPYDEEKEFGKKSQIKQETRDRRIEKAIQMLVDKRKTPDN